MATWQGEGGEGDRGGGGVGGRGGGRGGWGEGQEELFVPATAQTSLSPVVFGQARKLMASVNRDEEK